MSRNFRRSWVVAAGCLGLFGAVRVALAVATDQPEATGDANPYAVIVDKNVFHLNPPPPPPAPPEEKPADLPQYKLTGIVKIAGQTRVLFALTPKDAKELPTYLNLAPGERQGQLELVSIDREREEVAVINSGTPMTLSVKSNSYAVSGGSAPAAPAAPGGSGPRRLPGFPAPAPPPSPSPAPATAQAEAAPSSGGGVVIIGGGNSGSDNSGSNPNPAPIAEANYAGQGGGNFGGGNYGSGGSSGVSVSGNAPVNYGGAGSTTVATPNGATINLGATTPPGQTPSWPPAEQSDPAVQAAALLAASENGDNGKGGSTTTGNAATPASSKGGPPMPPIK